MIEHDVAIKLENHDQQIKSFKHRMESQERMAETIQDLVVSVKLLATNMVNMLSEQKEESERLAALEKSRQSNGHDD